MDRTTDREMLIECHLKSSGHRELIEASETCGCFYCRKMFPPKNIRNWIDAQMTALCPRCGIDAVLPGSYVELSDEFLLEMHNFWFGDKK